MNRSFRAQESQMQAAMRQRQQQLGGLRASRMNEKEEELALFLEMKKREKERNDLLNNSEDFDTPLGSKPGTSPIFNISSSLAPPRKTSTDDFLNSDNDKNDYDWLLTPPGTPLFPSLEVGSQKTMMSQLGTPKARPTVLKSRLANLQPEPTTRSNLISKPAASSPGLNNSSAGTRRPSSSGGPGSRPATPTGRPILTTTSKPSRSSTPTSRATLSSTRPSVSINKPTVPAAKSTLPANKSTVSAAKPAVQARSSTPLSRSTSRSSTPTARPTLPPSKSTSRAATPTRRPSTPSSTPSVSAPLIKSSSSVSKPAPASSRNVPSRGTSPTVKSRPWKPSEMPGFSLDAPPNLRTSVPERPLSATRGRPGQPSSRSSSIEPGSNGRPRRQSCSPSRGRAPTGMFHASGGSVPAVSRGYSKVNDNVSPVLIGTKMVERVINMRKLAPPKQDDKHSPCGNLSGKSSSSPDSSGFGRTLSKKSLDMAIRHMDIRRSIPGNLRPLMTNIPASSMYSVRSGPSRSRAISVSDSPLATSSNASSEVSVNNNGLCLDGSELEDEIGSERGGRSPASVRGR
ncbi:hypothetical protein I3843_01G288600 [Carya illinoinensis]|uniref:Uncharacterized protein n=1 Tax=Carya illinoinensis TaxID=32201 RepID=A0A922GCW5_CARIL|nr:hypothetical protein I3760_01G294500 [Carya illinoinensis]KAG6735018.1 hypothetical protein I3842_01G299300 [Carya illinoinensis]KAG7999082.1 hypothetical protein I3843_01G288600 [Carya illinoinensis]